MTKCDNCQTEFDPLGEGVTVFSKAKPAAGICGTCLTDATLIQVVLRRGDVGGFRYEQYMPLEVKRSKASAGGR